MDIITFILTLCTTKGLSETAASQAYSYATAAEVAVTQAGTYKTAAETAATEAETYKTAAEAAAVRAATYDHTLYLEELPGTTQTVAFGSNGEVASITHKQGNSIVRTDAFTYSGNTVTEVRTLSTGEKLTKVTNLDTLVTTVTYTA